MPIIEDVTVYLPSDAGYYNSTRFELWKQFKLTNGGYNKQPQDFCVFTNYLLMCLQRFQILSIGSEANGYDYFFEIMMKHIDIEEKMVSLANMLSQFI